MSNVPPPASIDRPHQEPNDAEVVYYQGSPPVRGLGAKLLLWPLAGMILIVVPFLLHWPMKITTACVVTGLIIPFPPVLWAKTIKYRITSYRIDYERGLISKDIDTLELWHVDDLHFHQSLWGRLLDVGSIRISSHDQTMPELMLNGIPNPRPLYETLKQRVIAVKRSRGVIKVDPG